MAPPTTQLDAPDAEALAVGATLRDPRVWDGSSGERQATSRVSRQLEIKLQPLYLGRFIVHRKLGEGGIGVVFAAFDDRLEREVAIKLLRDDRLVGKAGKRNRERLLREARALARISHPNVVQLHEVGDVGGELFIAMEYVRGSTLREWLQEERPLNEVLRLFQAVGAGLASAHAKGIVHRDFKPENVLIGRDGRPRVVDFGLAFAAHDPGADENLPQTTLPLTMTGTMVGTPTYMSPEQWQAGEVDARSDQYSFCVALYEALYGQRPFHSDKLRELAQLVLSEAPSERPLNDDVPQKLHDVLLRGLAKAPEERWPSMGALLTAVGRHAAESLSARRTRRAIVILGIGNALLLIPAVFQAQLGGISRDPVHWAVASGVSLGLLIATIYALRHRLRQQPANIRIVALAVASFAMIYLNRLAALFLATPFEHVFAYDFAALAVLGGAASVSVGRWLLPVSAACVVAFALALVWPQYAPLITLPVVIVINSFVLYHWWAGHLAQAHDRTED